VNIVAVVRRALGYPQGGGGALGTGPLRQAQDMARGNQGD